MTVTQAPPIPFGRSLGIAQRAGRALLDTVLGEEATTYETWIALNLIATGGPDVPREELERNLAAGLDVEDAVIAQQLGQLERWGLLRTEAGAGGARHIVLTEQGDAEYQRLLAAVNRRAAQVLGTIDPDDLQTTIRVLGQFKERAEALLAG